MEVVGEQIKRGRGNSWAHVQRIEGKVERGGETYRRVEKLIGDRNLQGVETYRETYRIGETKETYTSENAHRGERLTGE